MSELLTPEGTQGSDGFGFDFVTSVYNGADVPEVQDGYEESEHYGHMPSEPDIEALWAKELDHEADEKAIKEAMPPAGMYTTVVPMRSSRFTDTYTQAPRRIVTVFGKATSKNLTVNIRFRISPDKGLNRAGTGLAFDYVLYNQAKAAYQKRLGAAPRTIDDIELFLSDHSVQLRCYQGKTDLQVAEIRA